MRPGPRKVFLGAIFLGNFSQNCGYLGYCYLDILFWGGLMSMEQRYQGLGGVKMHVVLKEWNDYSPAAAENCLVVREHPLHMSSQQNKILRVKGSKHEHVTCYENARITTPKGVCISASWNMQRQSSRLDMLQWLFFFGRLNRFVFEIRRTARSSTCIDCGISWQFSESLPEYGNAIQKWPCLRHSAEGSATRCLFWTCTIPNQEVPSHLTKKNNTSWDMPELKLCNSG